VADLVRDDAVEGAIDRSRLGTLPVDLRDRLTSRGVRLDVPAGSTFYRDADSPQFGLVVDGIVRIYVTSAEGRQLTVRYARAGAILGAPTVVAGPVDVSAQALTDASVLLLDVESARALGRTQPEVGWLFAEEVTERLTEVLGALAGNVFGSVRQRVARHLLDIAAERQQPGTLIAAISQQALADAAGTAREVVARTLHDFREAGLVETGRDQISVVDPDGLSEVAESGD
jgi:CRP/FNR family transcriptional regulator, cyclic AMP receptor protein